MDDSAVLFTPNHIFELLDELAEAILVVDDTGKIQFMNPPARRLTAFDTETQGPNLNDLLDTGPYTVEPLAIDLGALRALRVSSRDSDRHLATLMTQQLQALLDLGDRVNMGLVAVDHTGRIHYLNHAAETLLGHPPARASGQHISWLMPNFDSEKLTASEYTAESTPVTFSFHHQEHMLAGQVFAFNEADNHNIRLVSLLDITPFQKHDANRTGLLRLIIHDLSNPLNIALNFANLLQHGVLATDETNQAKAIVATQLHRMQHLLEDLSLLDQLKENIQQSFEAVDLDVLVAIVINDLEQYAADNDVHLRLNPLPAGECRTIGNERLLRQAIYNLVENAIKYASGGWVRVTLRPKDSWMEILVADDGIGISPDQQPHVHRPFYRGQDPSSSHTNGTGLGLSLVHMIARQHDGKVWFHSVPNKGSIFALQLRNDSP